MGTETEEATEQAEYPVIKYDLTEAKIAELRAAYADLKIKGVEDKGGLALAHAGRMEIKGIRVAIDKRRKGFNAGALEFTRTVNAKAKDATAPLLPLEAHLKEEEDRIKAEKARIRAEAERREEERLQFRVNLLQQLGRQISIVNIRAMTDGEFQAAYDEAKAEHEAEQARLAKEEEERKGREEAERQEREAREEEDRKAREAEEARLAEQRAEQERVAKLQADAKAEMLAEQERIDASRQALENDKLIEAARKEAAEQARLEEKARAEREAAEKEEAERKAKEEAARQKELRPDKEKLEAYTASLLELPVPELEAEEAKEILEKARDMIAEVASVMGKAVSEL